MKIRKQTNLLLVALAALALAPLSAPAQEKPRVSPHETVNASISGNDITVVYGRPYSKDPKSGEKRKIWGGLVPFGQVWRLGADEATLLTTKEDIDLGGTKVPAGTYSLFLLPEANGAKLVVNKQTGQWGTKYDASQDLARVEMKKEAADKAVDQLTIAIESKDGGGMLQVMWEDVQYSVAIKNAK